MIVVSSRFDGTRIEVLEAMRGAEPGEVVIVYSGRSGSSSEVKGESPARSIWDVFGKAEIQRSAEDIDAQMREERESWGDR